MHLELVTHLAYAPDMPHPTDQLVEFILQYMSRQSDLAFEGSHGNGGGVSSHPAYRRPDPLVQHSIVDLIFFESRLQLGRGAHRTISGIPGRGRQTVAELVTRMHKSVAKQ
jgi:hypothetical protein